MNIYIVHTEKNCYMLSENIDSVWSSRKKAEKRFNEILQNPEYVDANNEDMDSDEDKILLYIDEYMIQ